MLDQGQVGEKGQASVHKKRHWAELRIQTSMDRVAGRKAK